jgi:membrane protein YqaA with SNARE-associated domain
MLLKAVSWVQFVLVPALGAPGLFLASFLDSSFLSIPEIGDLLVIASCAARPDLAWLPVVMATLGSVSGSSALWAIGKRGGARLLLRRFGRVRVRRTRSAFARWGLLALAVPALLPPPMPFKIFVFSAGAFGVQYPRFALLLLAARGLRYSFWGTMGVLYGDRARQALQAVDARFAQTGPWVLAGLGALFLGGWLFRRWRRLAGAHAAAAQPPV